VTDRNRKEKMTMIWDDLLEKYNAPETDDGIKVRIDDDRYLQFTSWGNVEVIKQGPDYDSVIVLADDRTPDEMDTIITALTKKRLTWADLIHKYSKRFHGMIVNVDVLELGYKTDHKVKILIENRSPDEMDELLQKLIGEKE
jgi:hypothetical protein